MRSEMEMLRAKEWVWALASEWVSASGWAWG
jgi:hypothetical protein